MKMVQGKDTLNENQSLLCWRWCHGPLLFLRQFLRFVLLLLWHHSGYLPSLMIICYLLSRFCTSSYSSCCSAKASWASLDIAALSSSGTDMEIAADHSWGDVIYHLFVMYLLRSIFDLFSIVSFEKCSFLCCNNASRITVLSVAGQHLLWY